MQLKMNLDLYRIGKSILITAQAKRLQCGIYQ